MYWHAMRVQQSLLVISSCKEETNNLCNAHSYKHSATSPAPQVGGDGQLYGAQQYQYPPYFAPTITNVTFASNVSASTQSKLSTNKVDAVKTLSAESNSSASAGASKGSISKGINVYAPVKPVDQSAFNTSSHLYGNSALGSGISASYQNPRGLAMKPMMGFTLLGHDTMAITCQTCQDLFHLVCWQVEKAHEGHKADVPLFVLIQNKLKTLSSLLFFQFIVIVFCHVFYFIFCSS